MYNLFNAQSGALLGEISEDQISFLRSQLEEESEADADYYINGITLDMLEANGADEALIRLLRKALGDNEDMDIRWE